AQRRTQLAGSVGEIPVARRPRTTRVPPRPAPPPATPHQLHAVERLDCADKHGGAGPRMTGHRVEAPVHAVAPVHVRSARWPEQMQGARREPGGSMARGIVRPEIRLGLHDPPARAPAGGIAFEDRTEERARHDRRRTPEEINREWT